MSHFITSEILDSSYKLGDRQQSQSHYQPPSAFYKLRSWYYGMYRLEHIFEMLILVM
ncbi:hypothetical protein F383_11832 [Gossypium arboreum]|uniref:Uncharacterized protein n=1 Tax=Gossypium arboreum TaxID=29729 RepID=A0A0B0PVC7_GOSAR|nr:hypothetical protein F383_11832 [Gossypium arboreum]